MSLAPALALRNVSKSFGDVRALHNVDLLVRPGTVHALLGENGAGKTTLMRIAFGLAAADEGTVQIGKTMLRGVSAHAHTPANAMSLGLGMVHQHFSLVSAMSVAENIALGNRGRFTLAKVVNTIREIGERTGLVLDPHARVGELSVSAQQRCEIIKALARNARILILDEPTAVLAPHEARTLLKWVGAFANEHPDNAVVLITHKLRDALAIADDVTVLRRGELVTSGSSENLTESSLAEAMLGPHERSAQLTDEVVPRVSRHTDSVGAHHVVVQADSLTILDERGVARVKNASFTVRAGEVVGLAAIEGAGQAELLRAVAGLTPVHTGRLHRPDDIGFVPEDRHRDALLLDASLTENFALRDAGVRHGRVQWNAIADRTNLVLRDRDVRATNAAIAMRTLSGGNQQKFVLARALDNTPPALVIENPTRGLDFRATAAVHAALHDARDAGIAVFFYSSDLDEVLTIADRVLVLHNGTLREVPREREAVGRAMLGVS